MKRDENRIFPAEFLFPGLFETGHGLRPHIRVEMSLAPPALPATARPIGSLIALAQGQLPEVAAFLSVDPVETGADASAAPGEGIGFDATLAAARDLVGLLGKEGGSRPGGH